MTLSLKGYLMSWNPKPSHKSSLDTGRIHEKQALTSGRVQRICPSAPEC